MTRPRPRRTAAQLPLALRDPPRRGGRRAGAGRPATDPVRIAHPSPRPCIARGPRPDHAARIPLHVTLRAAPEVANLRRRDGYRAVRWALAIAGRRTDFRIIHVSIQANHIHLIAEADDKLALKLGMQGTAISIARQLNRARGRRGRVWSDRYHARPLATPREVRNGIGYVLNNWRKHGEDRRSTPTALDPYASGIGFDGWEVAPSTTVPRGAENLPVCFPTTWLLRIGWRRHPAIGLTEVPGSSPRTLRG